MHVPVVGFEAIPYLCCILILLDMKNNQAFWEECVLNICIVTG